MRSLSLSLFPEGQHCSICNKTKREIPAKKKRNGEKERERERWGEKESEMGRQETEEEEAKKARVAVLKLSSSTADSTPLLPTAPVILARAHALIEKGKKRERRVPI